MNLENNEREIHFVADRDMSIREFYRKLAMSSRMLRRMFREECVLLNDQVTYKDMPVRKGDVLTIVFADEENEVEPQPMDLNILYEDFDLLAIDKSAGVVVHQTRSHTDSTLANGVSYYFKQCGLRRKVRFLNRLDRDTSGIVVAAKNSYAHQQLQLGMDQGRVVKKYYAVVHGIVEEEEGSIDLPIGQDPDFSVERIPTEDGQQAQTDYRVCERFREATLLEIQIHTGRTHQIRVHMKAIGHPIVGDPIYSPFSETFPRQALHSHYLEIFSVRTGAPIVIESKLPDDIRSLCRRLK